MSRRSPYYDCRTIFECTAEEHYDHILYCIWEDPDSINARNEDGTTPLMIAIGTGSRIPFMEMLIRCGADVNAKDDTGKSVLMSAACMYHSDFVQLLVENGARDEAVFQNTCSAYEDYAELFVNDPEMWPEEDYLIHIVNILKILIGHGFRLDFDCQFEWFLCGWVIINSERDLDSLMIGMFEKIENTAENMESIIESGVLEDSYCVYNRFSGQAGPFFNIGLKDYWNRDRVGLLTTLLLGRRWCHGCPFHEDVFPLEIFEMIVSYARLFFFPGEISRNPAAK